MSSGTIGCGAPGDGRELRDLLAGVQALAGLTDAVGAIPVSSVQYDSRRVTPGALFVCVRGFEVDGHRYAAQAAERGAVALVVDHELEVDLPQIAVGDTRMALATIARNYWGAPSDSMQVFGVTGTNGKTTTTYILDAILRANGAHTGLIGTVEVRVGGERRPAERTTPESAEVQALLAEMRGAGVSAVSIEVSSHAIDLHRVDGTTFAAVAFTNLTQDHLDYHRTLAEYRAVKTRLFFDYPTESRVIDVDTGVGRELADVVAATHAVVRVGRSEFAEVRAVAEVPTATGTEFTLQTPRGSRQVKFPLAGAYNVSNALLAAGCALSAGVDLDVVVRGLESAPQVPGRLERIECGQQFAVVVDYAHTPDSLDKALRALRDVTTGALRVVFGCGGDRDPSKRPLMGAVAGELADYSIVTSDNPRSEDPVSIIHQVELGVRERDGEYEVQVDRAAAIKRAIEIAHPGDCVLIAGKGHENYQIFAEHTAHFDDREVAREILLGLGYTGGCGRCS